MTKRRAVADTDRFSESFLGRIRALVRSHDLLLQGNLRGTDLACVISEEVNEGAVRSGNAIISGPNIHLDARTAGKLALVLHELASNARRYGALSAPDGMLRIDWSVAEDTAELALRWSESCGQSVSAPADTGYGISLIRSVVASMEGNTSFDFGPDGLHCTITLPRPKDEWSDST
ncbi:hypothetical protein C5F48_22940 [Cereibacter changlensis JA139]|uniref:histidine kinase n=1 Tax=Cereibacter changlensis JA139 TaxID=1188249 RepID=A0A2T4JNF0_9RHOB|nr:sensor histidine kinase [Cereibacter changlensis]PTE19434.1 hypothetical protein C5F48_22940 [Cereibacter changlensis JA139]